MELAVRGRDRAPKHLRTDAHIVQVLLQREASRRERFVLINVNFERVLRAGKPRHGKQQKRRHPKNFSMATDTHAAGPSLRANANNRMPVHFPILSRAQYCSTPIRRRHADPANCPKPARWAAAW